MSTVSEPQTKYRFLPFVKCTDHLICIGFAVFILFGVVAVAWDKTDSEIGSAIALGAATVFMIFVMMVLVYLPRNRIAEEMLAVSKFRAKLTEDSNKINREALENNQKQQMEDTIMNDAVAYVQQVKFNIPEKVFPRKESNSIYQYLDKLLRNKYEAIKQHLDNFSIEPRFMIVTGSPGVGKTITIKQALNKMKGVIPIYVNIESSDQVNHEWFKSLILEELGAKESLLSFKKFLKTLSEECRNDPFVIYADMKVNGTISAEDLQLIGSSIGSFGRLLSELQCPFIIEISNSHISNSIINSRDLSGIFKEVRVHMTLEEFSLCCYAEIKDEYNDIIFAQGTTISSEEYLNEYKDALTEWYFMVGNNPRQLRLALESVKQSEGGQKQFHEKTKAFHRASTSSVINLCEESKDFLEKVARAGPTGYGPEIEELKTVEALLLHPEPVIRYNKSEVSLCEVSHAYYLMSNEQSESHSVIEEMKQCGWGKCSCCHCPV